MFKHNQAQKEQAARAQVGPAPLSEMDAQLLHVDERSATGCLPCCNDALCPVATLLCTGVPESTCTLPSKHLRLHRC